VDPKLTPTPATVSFPDTVINTTSAPIPVSLKNTGVGNLVISSSSLAAPYSASGLVTPLTLAANASQSVNLTFAPTAPGTFNATWTVASNDAASPKTISVSGKALAPRLTSAPTSYDFNAVDIAQSAQNVFTLTNTGDSTLTVSAISISGPNATEFTLVSPPTTPLSLA